MAQKKGVVPFQFCLREKSALGQSEIRQIFVFNKIYRFLHAYAAKLHLIAGVCRQNVIACCFKNEFANDIKYIYRSDLERQLVRFDYHKL